MEPVGSIADEKSDSSNDKEQSFSQSTSETKQQDHYALLGLSHLRCLASLDDIKNNFKPIKEAYEVLSDPILRSNYDFTDCAPRDFFKFYGPVFSSYEGWSVNQPVPSLGDDKTSMKDVDSFYEFWNTFKSSREFPQADERQNAEHNEKAREEESARISSLVQTAYKRDPRIKRRKEEEEKAAEAIMRRKEEEEKAAEVASPEKVGKKEKKLLWKERDRLSDTLKYPEGTSRGSEAIPESIGTTRRSAEEIPKEIHVEEIPKATKTDLVQKPDSTKSFDSTKSIDSSTNATEGHAPKSETSRRNKVKKAKKKQRKEAKVSAEKRQKEEDKKADEEQWNVRAKEKKLLQKERARLRKLTTDDLPRRLLNLTQKDVENFCTLLNMDELKSLSEIIESLDMDRLKSVQNNIETVKMAHCPKDEPKAVMSSPSSKGSPPSSTSPRRLSGNLGSIDFLLRGPPHKVTDGSKTREYYEGSLVCEGKHEEDVCFLCIKKSNEANKLYKFSRLIEHPRIMRARFCFYDDVTANHLICYDKFVDLGNADYEYSNKLDAPKLSSGIPNDVVRCEIKGLLKASDHMILENTSSSWLDKSIGYVWCPDRHMAKILIVDRLLKTDSQRNNHIRLFKDGIVNNFLKAVGDVGDWPERSYFLQCLVNENINPTKRMLVVYKHPFLENKIGNILRFFYDIYHAINATNYYDDVYLLAFNEAIKQKPFVSQFLQDGKWTRDFWSKEFQDVFVHKNAMPYNEKDFRDLLRFLRNAYTHHCDTAASMKKIFEGIKKNWPGLIEICYEKVHEA